MPTTLIRTLILYLVVVAALRIMGKRQIGEMKPQELVIAFLVSELAALPMTDLNRPLMGAVVAIFVLVALEIFMSSLSLKSPIFRRVLNGKPAIVVHDGVINQKMLRRLRLSVEELTENLRQKDIFHIDTIQYAIVETSGQISVIEKPEHRKLSPKDMNQQPPDDGIAVGVICDGKVRKQSFRACNLNEKTLNKELKKRNLQVEDVFLMTADKSDNYVIIRKDEN